MRARQLGQKRLKRQTAHARQKNSRLSSVRGEKLEFKSTIDDDDRPARWEKGNDACVCSFNDHRRYLRVAAIVQGVTRSLDHLMIHRRGYLRKIVNED